MDITNYNDKGSVATNVATQRVRAIPQSEELHVVERFTRVDENTINYEVDIEDPKVFTAPWKVAMPLNQRAGLPALRVRVSRGQPRDPNTLSAGRAQDRAASEPRDAVAVRRRSPCRTG